MPALFHVFFSRGAFELIVGPAIEKRREAGASPEALKKVVAHAQNIVRNQSSVSDKALVTVAELMRGMLEGELTLMKFLEDLRLALNDAAISAPPDF